MKKIAVTGYKGKLGSLLVQRPNFVPLGCDILDIEDIEVGLYLAEKYGEIDLIVNCASVSSITKCEEEYDNAIQVNVRGLDNLHHVFGDRVLNISSDHVFSGNFGDGILPTEETDPDPINAYGFTKMGAEAVSQANEGKTIRLSRTVSWMDKDIAIPKWLAEIPIFFYRNYIHREFAVDGIEYFANNYDRMPSIVHYAGTDNLSQYDFMKKLLEAVGVKSTLIAPKTIYSNDPPRPQYGGFSVASAESLGFPMYSVDDTVSKLVEEYHNA